MKDMIYYNPTTNPMTRVEKSSERRDSIVKQEGEKLEERIKTPEPPPQQKQAAPFVPQLKLGPNGEMILDEQSLVVQSNAEKEAQRVLQNAEVVYEDRDNGRYGYFKRQKRTKDWSPDETIKFYRCLHTVGTDFSLMLQLFPNRSRRELKIKFKKEERNNCHLIDKAILYPKEFDIEALQKELEEEEAERARREEELRNRIEEENQLKKSFVKKRNEELKGVRSNAPQRWLTKTSRSLIEVDTVYKTADLGPRPKKQPKRKTTTVQPRLEVNKEELLDDTEEHIVSKPTKLQSIKLEKPDVDQQDNHDQSYSFPQESDLLSESESEHERKPSLIKLETESSDPVPPTIPSPIQPIHSIQKESEECERETQIDLDDIDLDSLVLCTVLDPKGEVTYQVFMQDPNTGELCDQPLDLAQDVIDTLINNLSEK